VAACSFTVTVETDMVIENIEVVDAVLGQANGSIILVVAGGLPPYVQQWFQDANPLPGFDPQQVGAGTYSVIITDAAGCSVSMTDIQVNGINASRETSINQEISVYPNPSSGQVFIELKNGGKPLAINLYDVSGRNLPIKKLNHNNLDISALPPGVYWLKIEDDGQPTWKKIVKI
jgi:hypothetical protein